MVRIERGLGAVLAGMVVACAPPPAPPPPRPAPIETRVPPPTREDGAPPTGPHPEGVVPDLSTLVFSEDESWSAVAATRHSEGEVVALVRDQGDRRALERVLPVGNDPVLSFVGRSLLVVQDDDNVTLADAEHQLVLACTKSASPSTTWEGHWATITSDGELVVVDTNRLVVAARMKLGLEGATLLERAAGDRFAVRTESGVLVVVDLPAERELLRLSGVADYRWRGDDLVTVQEPFPWKVVFHDVKSGRATWTRVEPDVWGGSAPELGFVPGKDELVITASRDPETRAGRDAPNLELVETRNGKARQFRIPVQATPEAFGPSVTEGGVVCVERRYSFKDFELDSTPAFDLRRGTSWVNAANDDALCIDSHLMLLPAKLRGKGRSVVRSIKVFGMFVGLRNNMLGPGGLLARVETDTPVKGGDSFVGANPVLALIDTSSEKKLQELPLPALDGVPQLAMQFSRDGKRLAVCWNSSLFVLDLTRAPSRAEPLADCSGAFDLSGRGRYLVLHRGEPPIDVGTGKRLAGSWWQ